MTKPNSTLITFILDRSGSMGTIKEPTIAGFNKFIEEQKKLTTDETLVSLYQFDHEYETVFENRKLLAVENLTDKTFVPRGNTALLDAIGKTIVTTGQTLAAKPENERPSLVIMVIITDGAENASTEYNRAQIFDMIKHQTDAYSWQFVFLGANQDAIAEAARFGILSANAMSYAATKGGVSKSYEAMARNIVSTRSSRDIHDIAFTSDQRTEAADGDDKVFNPNNPPVIITGTSNSTPKT